MDECGQSVIQSRKTQLMVGGRGGGGVGGGGGGQVRE